MTDTTDECTKRGRPKWVPPNLKHVEKLASQGLNEEQIAAALGCGISTLRERKRDFQGFSDAIKEGQAKGIATISNALFVNAKKGNYSAQSYYLNNRAGWSHKSETKHDGQITMVIAEDERDL